MDIKHILVTTDLSPEALRPCDAVAELARSSGARITLLHVVQDLVALPHGAAFAPGLSVPDLQNNIAAAQDRIEEQRQLFADDLDVTTEVISGNDVARALAHYAKQNQVDLIALSTHGRTGVRHLVLGSVAEAVLRRSPVPVLVFPQPKPEKQEGEEGEAEIEESERPWVAPV